MCWEINVPDATYHVATGVGDLTGLPKHLESIRLIGRSITYELITTSGSSRNVLNRIRLSYLSLYGMNYEFDRY